MFLGSLWQKDQIKLSGNGDKRSNSAKIETSPLLSTSSVQTLPTMWSPLKPFMDGNQLELIFTFTNVGYFNSPFSDFCFPKTGLK